MATKVLFPENSPIVLRYNYTTGQFPPRKSNKFVHVYICDKSIDPTATGLNLCNPEKDEVRFTKFAPPVAAAPTLVNPVSNFTANWAYPTGITQALLFVFLDAGRQTLHPNYPGILVSGTSLLVNVASASQYVEYALISVKDGKPVSEIGNGKIVSVDSILTKAGNLGLIAYNFDLAPTYVAADTVPDPDVAHVPGLVDTVTKNQSGLLSDVADESVSVAGGTLGGYFRQDLDAFDFNAMVDGSTLHLWLVYKLSANTNTQRLAAISSTTGNATFQFAASDTAAVNESRIMIRNNSNGVFYNKIIAGYRDTNTHAILLKMKKTGANYELKFFARDVGGSAAQIGATDSSALVSGNSMSLNVVSFMAWVRSTITNRANGKFQYGGFKIGPEISDANILDLLNTGTLV